MNYDDMKLHDPDDFFSLLLHTGYLTAIGNTSENNYTVKIPNKEILDCFNANIKKAFDDSLTLVSDKKNALFVKCVDNKSLRNIAKHLKS